MLYGHLQFVECVIPLSRDHLERAARLFQLLGFEFPPTFPSYFDVAHQACIGKHVQMLRDGLARNSCSGCELCNRQSPAGAEDSDDAQAGFVPERREDRRKISQ